MSDKCNHPANALIDMTEMGHTRYHYLCTKCREVVIGYPIVECATVRLVEFEDEQKKVQSDT